MKYIDNLIAWGDQLFRRDTIEAINEATQLYVLAADTLGPRPESIPPRGVLAPETYAQLKDDSTTSRTRWSRGEPFPFSTTAPPAGNGGGPATTLDRGRARSTSASRRTTSCWATGTPSPTGCSRSATA